MLKRVVWELVGAVLVIAACSGSATPESAFDADDAAGANRVGSGEVEVTLAQGGGTLLEEIQARQSLRCGVSGAAQPFSVVRPDRSYAGFNADYCRVVAAAVLGDANAVKFVPLIGDASFVAVQTGEVDLLIRNVRWTQEVDTALGIDFGPVIFHDGQQFMGLTQGPFSWGDELDAVDGRVICAVADSESAAVLQTRAIAADLSVELQLHDDMDLAIEGLTNRGCDAVTAEGTELLARKAEQQPDDEDWVIFPSAPITNIPLAVAYGEHDPVFADVVNWAVFATIIADEWGITADNIDDMLSNGPPAIAALLGGDGQGQTAMGLTEDAFHDVIVQVGSYGDIYGRHFVPLGLTREGSVNALWSDGGLLVGPSLS